MARNKEQNLIMRTKRRAQIMDAALILFSKEGFDNVAVDDIANYVQMSHGLFYHYFDNKKDVLKAILKQENKTNMMFREIIDEALINPIVGFEHLISFVLNGLADSEDKLFPHQVNLIVSMDLQKSLHDVHAKAEVAGHKGPMQLLNDVIAEGQQQGVFRDDILSYDLALIYHNFFRGLVSSRINQNFAKYKYPQTESLMAIIRKRTDD